MKRVENYHRNVMEWKNYSIWLSFDVKILKERFRKGWERFKTGFPQKALKKVVSWCVVTGRVMSESWASLEMSRESFWMNFTTGELVASESRKTLTPVFQHRTCLNNEKQCKHKTWTQRVIKITFKCI